ncbi:MAG: hypothetical protein J3R72DRAFT_56906 [Linnemannia gamsii]|nr:MAG: hypothetical protein J3R72DRAFT_56906 [Linnemannia gamsii]
MFYCLCCVDYTFSFFSFVHLNHLFYLFILHFVSSFSFLSLSLSLSFLCSCFFSSPPLSPLSPHCLPSFLPSSLLSFLSSFLPPFPPSSTLVRNGNDRSFSLSNPYHHLLSHTLYLFTSYAISISHIPYDTTT